MTALWSFDGYRAALKEQAAAFVATVEAADPGTPVPTCPEWTLADLMRHHGTTYRWANHLITVRARRRIWSRDVPLSVPAEVGDYAAWVAESAALLLDTLERTDPDTPVWHWGADRWVRFWPRRVLHEGVIHSADARIALGLSDTIDARLAADGIEEYLSNLPFASWIAPRLVGVKGSIVLRPTDAETGWRIVLTGDWFGWEWSDDEPGDAEISGTASDLMLLVYGRVPRTDPRFTSTGDGDVLAWLDRLGL